MRVLVTGGSGFIGHHVVENLLGKGHEVVVLDLVRPAQRDARVRWVHEDLRNPATMQTIEPTDGVIHLAGVLGTAETVERAWQVTETNVRSAINVFDHVREREVPAVNIAVGNVGWLSPYPISKYAAELYAFMYNREFETRIANVRVANAYGPRQHHAPVMKLVPNLVRSALRGEPMPLFGDGTQLVDPVYVTDVAECLVRALLVDHGTYDSVMEVGPGSPVRVYDMALWVWRMVSPTSEPLIENVPMRRGEPAHSHTEARPSTLAPIGFNWRDFVSLADGLERTIAWYSENRGFIDA